MSSDQEASGESAFALKVYGFYSILVSVSEGKFDSGIGTGLGGSLLYVGELDEDGRAVVVAANIAGAATLCATADQGASRKSLRDGVVDFLVTSLDEALRILKNEIRKRETVSVCVGVTPEGLEREMVERGVLPDLLRPSAGMIAERQDQTENDPMAAPALVEWRVESGAARWLPKLDAIALDCLEPGAGVARRWVRFGPRYLGRMAQGTRLLVADREFAAKLVERVREAVEGEKIAVPVEIRTAFKGGNDEVHLVQKAAAKVDEA